MAGPATCLWWKQDYTAVELTASVWGPLKVFFGLSGLSHCEIVTPYAWKHLTGGENGLCLSKNRSLKWGEAWLSDPVRLLVDDDRRDVIVSWWVEFGVWTPIRPPPLSHWITLLISILASTATAGHSWDLRTRLVPRQDLCFYSNKDEFVLTLGTIVPGYFKWNFESIIRDYGGHERNTFSGADGAIMVRFERIMLQPLQLRWAIGLDYLFWLNPTSPLAPTT